MTKSFPPPQLGLLHVVLGQPVCLSVKSTEGLPLYYSMFTLDLAEYKSQIILAKTETMKLHYIQPII